ncbi:ATP-binding protein [Pedobacter frigidisoli]|uniref:sensor histidine kinase n=1 Tax=Pedobacter frigidisoli TaxID=2530455 RepID=UPI00292DD86E|nr:ATP-binding protein [Pedobacter frigidisoli]
MQNQREQIRDLTIENELLENYFSNTIIPQLFVDAELILRKFTPPAMRQFKLEKEYVGKSMEDIKDNFRFPGILENIKIVIATGKILEKEVQTTDMRWFQMNILPYVVRKEKKADGVIITFVDITARVRDLKDQERLVAEHELLLDTIAHDIKNPLLGLNLGVEVMKNAIDLDGKLAKLITGFERSLTNLKQVVEGLIQSHWSKQKYQASSENIDIEEILQDVRLSLASAIQDTGAVISYRLDLAEIVFVRRKLRSIIYNLISNAIKYTPADRKPDITISSEITDGFTLIKVSDKGIGLNKDSKSLILEKFKRVTTNVEGSGVGLYLVNAIVTSAGGKIEIEGEEGLGSTFKIFLPVQ